MKVAMTSKLLRSLLPWCLVACSASPAHGPTSRSPAKHVEPRKWEHERSDIPADPRIQFGSLDNGMRYAWMKNVEPKQRCYLRLHVDVGSLAEKDDERGMAHYLEHMAFNGSRHYPAGTLIEWFQKHGMAFGADTNAFTGFSETVYQIDLPTSDEASIVEGLGVLRDFADGLLIEKKEVDSERGVIDAEERERDSPGHRIQVRSWQIELAGTRIPDREPIGVKAVRDRFTSESIRAFYRRWYRPENFTCILVGDLGDLDPAPLIRKAFGDVSVPEEPREHEPPVGKPAFATRFYAIPESDASSVTLAIERALPWEERADDQAEVRRELPLRVARRMLDLRFEELAKREGAPFLSAGVGSLRDSLRAEDGEDLTIACTAEKWSQALVAGEAELRRAVEFGFQDSELAEVRADYLRGLDEGVDREKTRSSGSCVDELVDAAEERTVSASAATVRTIVKPLLEALDAKTCSDALAARWKQGALIVNASGKLDLGPDAAKKIQEAYETSAKTPVERSAAETAKPFAYASDPAKTGAIASRSRVDEFDLEEVVFENGVRLHVKKTDFKEKQLLVSALIGEGRLAIGPGQQALGSATAEVFTECGLGAHSVDDLRKLNAGKEVQVSFGVDTDHFVLGGATTKEDLLRELELLRAHIVDPGWREEGLRPLKKGIPVFFDSLEHQPGGPITSKFLPEFYSGDERFRFPKREEYEAVTTAAMREWLAPQLEQAPIDLVVVGDLDVEATVGAAARTFGTLPARRAAQAFEERRKPVQMQTGLKERYEIETDVEKSLVLVLFPATDGRDTTLRRRVFFLSQVLADRLRVEVREKLGASYSPDAAANLSETFPGDGWILVQAMADPEKVDELVEACFRVTDDMSEKGLTEDEVERQRKPAKADIRDRVRTNGYWLEALSRLHGREHVFEDIRSLTTFVDGIRVQDLEPLAKEYLKRDRACVAIVAPKKKG